MSESIFHFKQFSIIQNSATLKIGTDAVLLGALTKFANPNYILDIGTGTGILSLMMAQKNSCSIFAIDIEQGAIDNAKQNFILSPWATQIECIHSSLENFVAQNTLQFEGIICNPPFFSNSLLSGTYKKDIARHTLSLTPLNLMGNVRKIISNTGIFSIIIPYSEKQLFTEAAMQCNLYIIHEIEISPFYNTPPNRIIIWFSPTWRSTTKYSITIRESQNRYSKEFKEITKDFYLT